MATKLALWLALQLSASTLAAMLAESPYKPVISWSSCRVYDPSIPPEAEAATDCGAMQVPLDHADPSGALITIRMARLKANGTDKCRGTYFVNPGGPGLSSMNQIGQIISALRQNTAPGWDKVHALYDLVGVDVRGVGLGEPLKFDPSIAGSSLELILDDATFNRSAAANRAFYQELARQTGPLFAHMGTDSAVQDLDLVREALGEDKLNLVGYSYGTSLGQQYILRFPERVGRIVLDGVAERSMTTEMALYHGAVATEAALDQFFQWCNATADCAMHGLDQPRIFDQVVHQIEQGNVTGNGTTETVASFMYAVATNWMTPGKPADFFVALDQLIKGNLTAWITPRSSANSTYALNGPAKAVSQAVVWCSDRAGDLSARDFQSAFRLAQAVAPHTRGYSVMSLEELPCVGWPISTLNPPRVQDLNVTRRLPPVVLVTSYYDDATPSAFTVDLRAQLPTSVTLLRDGVGHTSFGVPAFKEISAVIAAYMVNGTVPPDASVYSSSA